MTELDRVLEVRKHMEKVYLLTYYVCFVLAMIYSSMHCLMVYGSLRKYIDNLPLNSPWNTLFMGCVNLAVSFWALNSMKDFRLTTKQVFKEADDVINKMTEEQGKRKESFK